MVKDGNKRIMITFSDKDYLFLEDIAKQFKLTKSQIIHYFITGELKNKYTDGGFVLEMKFNHTK